jgi:hypothetical protein
MAVEPEPTPLPSGFSPIIVYNGVVTCQNSDGAVDIVKLASHVDVFSKGRGTLEKQQKCFCQNLALLRFEYAWDIAKQVNLERCHMYSIHKFCTLTMYINGTALAQN